MLLPMHIPVFLCGLICGWQYGATEPVFVQPRPIGIIEGAYSCHPYLWDCYDLRIFLDIDRERQLQRIRERNGAEQLNIFQKQWIPFEEQYFSAYRIPQRCDLSFLS